MKPHAVFVVSDAGNLVLQLDRVPATVGRSRQCEIRVDDDSVSRTHARIDADGTGGYTITDLASVNGTSVNSVRIPADRPTPVRLGDAVTLGSCLLVIREVTSAPLVPALSLLGPAAIVRRLESLVRDAAQTGLGCGIVLASARGELGPADLDRLASVVRAPDSVGRRSLHEWLVVIDDTPVGRARAVQGRVQAALRETRDDLVFGSALWGADGRTATELLASASAAASRGLARPAPRFGRGMTDVLAMVDRVAGSNISVLLHGETGVGKELLAERIHARSARSDRPFIKLNCASLTEPLLESELFGHLRGAFTGADRDKVGLLFAADGGTVFLDEVAELPLPVQSKLLRVLESGELRRVGAVTAETVDVRFIAATNQSLDDATRFRRDLYYRIAGAVIDVPPLRARVDEIAPLAHEFLALYALRLGVSPPQLGDAAVRILEAHPWPGNVRELRNVMERAAILCDGLRVEPGDIPLPLADAVSAAPSIAENGERTTAVHMVSRQVTRAEIVDALQAHGGNQGLAAAHLGVHRRTLMRWMDVHAIPRPRKR